MHDFGQSCWMKYRIKTKCRKLKPEVVYFKAYFVTKGLGWLADIFRTAGLVQLQFIIDELVGDCSNRT